MDFRRSHVSEIVKRMREEPRFIIYVTGPRQTGKTTAVLQALDEVDIPGVYLTTDDDETVDQLPPLASHDNEIAPTSAKDRRWLVHHWQVSRFRARQSESGFILVLDEIERIPDWSRTVKGLWDADRRQGTPLRVVILGSAHLVIQTGLSESLAGRFEPLRFTHWSFQEMAEAFGFDVDQYVYFGGSPGAAALAHDQDRWRDYVQTALMESAVERDILAVARVGKPALFKQLLELGCVLSGQVVSYSKMLGQLQDAGNTTTVPRYLELLNKAGLLVGLEQYSGDAIRQVKSIPKLNVLNTAFVSAFSDYDYKEAQENRNHWGHCVESAVGAHLLNSKTTGIRVYYWRYRNHEVDFVVSRGRKLVAIKVKSETRRSSATRMKAFKERFPTAISVVVGANHIALSEFLSVPVRHWFARL